MTKSKSPSKRYKNSALYSAVLVCYRIFFFGLLRGRIRGREHIPQSGPVILMSNHIHALDPFTLGLCAAKRQVRFLAKKELFRHKWLAAILGRLHAISVDRGQFDLAAMRECAAVLRAGEALGVFPEGTRGGGKVMGPLLSGAAVLALRSDAPVVPVRIQGKYRLFGGPQVALGTPVEINDLRAKGADKEAADVFLGRMGAALEGLGAKLP
ncbi:MAG: 1-acyl-sn-glycerol-3-phosphate acyltransferase [Clostridia bacterium]|nr:1-acyl-sn-glycerol-3-phosphate acyltransferase [Clostridia bacterium]